MILSILGVEHKIVFADNLSPDGKEMGNYEQEKALITIDVNMQAGVEDYILAHEIVHAISDMLELGLTEQQVASLGVGLNSVVKTWKVNE